MAKIKFHPPDTFNQVVVEAFWYSNFGNQKSFCLEISSDGIDIPATDTPNGNGIEAFQLAWHLAQQIHAAKARNSRLEPRNFRTATIIIMTLVQQQSSIADNRSQLSEQLQRYCQLNRNVK